LVRRQKMHGSQRCCGELVELTDDDVRQIADAGDNELRRLRFGGEGGAVLQYMLCHNTTYSSTCNNAANSAGKSLHISLQQTAVS